MKIVFLDIDGVLNSRQYDAHRGINDGNVDVSRLELLKQLVERTGAKIVLTSSWRRHWNSCGEPNDKTGEELQAVFERYGIQLYDKTPEINGDRVKEIKAWLDVHPDVLNFVIIDDTQFGWGEFESNVVKTNYLIGRGLEERHIESAVSLLNR